eukprot:1190680-Prorocentrum_minimum.AAC.7
MDCFYSCCPGPQKGPGQHLVISITVTGGSTWPPPRGPGFESPVSISAGPGVHATAGARGTLFRLLAETSRGRLDYPVSAS